MKELKTPHNDWWNDSNQLIFLPNHFDDDVNLLVKALVDAKDFSDEVYAGINKLKQSSHFKKLKNSVSLQEQLRPLFCTTEINIESNENQEMYYPIAIPSAFFLNPLLDQIKIVIPEQAYQNLLTKNNMQFPETLLNDADHAWLAPVKGINNINAIKQLIKNKIITRHFAQSVLMIDYSHPAFSKRRCALLKLVPAKHDYNWVNTFINQLHQEQGKQPDALLLASYLINREKYNHDYFQQVLSEFKSHINRKTKSTTGLQEIFSQLLETRQSVLDNELSKNPLGQILEPGFRVIFPISSLYNF